MCPGGGDDHRGASGAGARGARHARAAWPKLHPPRGTAERSIGSLESTDRALGLRQKKEQRDSRSLQLHACPDQLSLTNLGCEGGVGIRVDEEDVPKGGTINLHHSQAVRLVKNDGGLLRTSLLLQVHWPDQPDAPRPRMQWTGKQFNQFKRLFQPKPSPSETEQQATTAPQASNDTRSKEHLRLEAQQLQGQLDALVSDLEATAVNGVWVQRFIDIHQQRMEIGCRLEDGTVNVNAEVKRLRGEDLTGASTPRRGFREAAPEEADDLERSYAFGEDFLSPGSQGRFNPPGRQPARSEDSFAAKDAAIAGQRQEAAKREQEERLAIEEKDAARKEEEERLAREEAARKEEEEWLAREEAARKEEEERLAIEEAARKEEEERLAREEAARKEEEERVAAEEGARKEEGEAVGKEVVSIMEEPGAASKEEEEILTSTEASKQEEHRPAKDDLTEFGMALNHDQKVPDAEEDEDLLGGPSDVPHSDAVKEQDLLGDSLPAPRAQQESGTVEQHKCRYFQDPAVRDLLDEDEDLLEGNIASHTPHDTDLL
eukprot:g1661.t1